MDLKWLKIKAYFVIAAFIFGACTGQEKHREYRAVSMGVADKPAPENEAVIRPGALVDDTIINVLVLPAYDEIANIGGSPDTQAILEKTLGGHDTLKIIPFRLQKLMGVPYHMIYDKKYCKPVLDKVPADIVVMSKIITKNEHEPGIWPWHYEVKVYNVRTGRQRISISGRDLEAEEFLKDIGSKKTRLISDIFATFMK